MLSTWVYCLLGILPFGLGAILSLGSKAYMLVPLTFAAWIGAAILSHFAKFGFIETIVAAVLAGSCLQIGYVAGAFVLPVVTSKKRSAVKAQQRAIR